jgi:hypothetical protein
MFECFKCEQWDLIFYLTAPLQMFYYTALGMPSTIEETPLIGTMSITSVLSEPVLNGCFVE